MAGSREVRPKRGESWWVTVVLIAIMIAAFFIRWRLRACPLERDEGEYAYLGRLILEGLPPYGVAGNHKFPGAYLAYAAIMAVFGETISGIHVGMLLVNLTNTLLLFFLGRRLSGNVAGLAAAAAWVVMSESPSVFGNAGHLTHFVVLAVLAGGLLLWRWLETGRDWCLVGAGFCLGASVMFRQTSLIFIVFGLGFVWLATKEQRARHAVVFATAAIVPLIVMGIWLWLAGVFPQFWRWTFAEAAAYGSQVSFIDGWKQFLIATPRVIDWNVVIWAGAGIGLAMALRTHTKANWFVVGLLVAGLVALLPGFYFREHYYIQAVPAIALLFGTTIQRMWDDGSWWRHAAMVGSAVAVVLPVAAQPSYFLETSPIALARYVYGGNPFPEAIEVAKYLRDNSEAADPIAVLGSEPEIFFYAERRSATSLIYTYPLMEHHQYAHGLQETMAREIEQAAPKFIVFVNAPTSWLAGPESDRFILTWADEFLSRYYRLDGIADILAEGSQYVWGAAAASYRPRSPYFVTVYRRGND